MLILFLLCCLLGFNLMPVKSYDYQVDNDNITYVESKYHNNFVNGDSLTGGICAGEIEEFCSGSFIFAFITGIKDSTNIFGTGISYQQFISGSDIVVDTAGSLSQSLFAICKVSVSDGSATLEPLVEITRLKIHCYKYTVGNYAIEFDFYIDNSIFTNDYCLSSWTSFAFTDVEETRIILTSPINYRPISYSVNPTFNAQGLYVMYGVFYFAGLLPANIDKTATYEAGYRNGYQYGVTLGQEWGYADAEDVYNNPNSTEYQNIYNAGKQVGVSEGYQSALEQGTTAATIFSGIVNVGLLPVNVFLKIFEFEVFGINIAGLISALLTVSVTIILIRFLTGQKNDK